MRAVDFMVEVRSGGDPLRLLERFEREAPRVDMNLNIFITMVSPEPPVGPSPENAPLYMVPIAVKDNIVTKGVRTTCASRVLENYVPSYDATVIERLKRSGAVVVGKANMDEFAMGALGTTSAFGPTRNPLNPSLSPGGSSSGSAAAVASGLVPMALGSDTGGSVRLPAAWTGICGLKPTYGLVSRYGLISYADSLDQIGPMAASVFDLELLFSVIMGWDPRDPTSYEKHPPPELFARRAFANPSPEVLRGLRVGLIKESLEHPDADEGVIKRFMRYLSALGSEGAVVEEVRFPLFSKAPPTYYVIAFSEAFSNLSRFMGLLYGSRTRGPEEGDWKDFFGDNRALFGWEVKRRILLGAFALSAGYYDMYYGRALRVRARIANDLLRLLERYDVLVTPGSPVPPLPLDFDATDLARLNAVDAPMVIANLAGLPALVLPLEVRGDGPVSIQLISGRWTEDLLFEVGKAIAVYVAKTEREVRAS